jgi:uncharacterized protein YciI
MLQWLYRLRPARPEMLTEGLTEREAAVVQDHFHYLTRLTSEGTVVIFGRTLNIDDDTMGICIFLAPTEAAARAVIDNDPAVVNGVMTVRLFPYRIAGLNAGSAAPRAAATGA